MKNLWFDGLLKFLKRSFLPYPSRERFPFSLIDLRTPVLSAHFAGGLIIVEAYDAVVGIDPVTGRVAWTFGRVHPPVESDGDPAP